MLTSMVVLEGKAGEGGAIDSKSGASVGPPSSDDGESNERMIFENSAGLLWDEERGKWRIYDWKDEFHGYRRSRAEAERFAEGLPGPPP